MTTKTLTFKMDTTITSVPTLTTVQPDIAPPVTSVVNSSSHQSSCTLVSVMQCMPGSLIRIQVTGDGLDCLQPSTLVYTDLSVSSAPATISNYMNKQECGFERSSNSQNPVTCTYECLSFIPFHVSVRFGVQVQRLSWLARSQNLEQFCDIQAFMWV